MVETQKITPNGASADVGSPLAVVRQFLAALEALDVDRALELTGPDIVYQNVPLPPARGRKAFERQMRAMARVVTGFEARIHNIAERGSIVLTERTDVLEIGPWKAEFWVCGTFEVREGRIVLWRDYFDWTTFVTASLWGVPRALGSLLRSRRVFGSPKPGLASR